ncbi:Rossmann-fold NAD(P)-binding domain-containing protein [Woodsholea maritima]|uniref:hypothetical protein n=1 Tax=Woodsholea maritima TaxID=240237 RepID=UPI000376F161|nr:hypothetical protein [Woodsholea maritima]
MTDAPLTLFLGYGFCAAALAPHLKKRSHTLIATTRSAQKAQDIGALGYDVILTDGSVSAERALSQAFQKARYVVCSAPPGAQGDPFLPALLPLITAGDYQAQWIGYISTTGIYGDRQGGWAFEDDAPRPGQRRSHWRAGAEASWIASGAPVRLFRCAGIYGPGRSVFDKIREGTAKRVDKPGQVFSRIHTEDIARALLASMDQPDAPGPFNLADDCPAPQHEVIAHACGLIGAPAPPLEPFAPDRMSAMAASFYAENRRVSNARAKAQLGWRPLYPNYQSGLAAILAAGG